MSKIRNMILIADDEDFGWDSTIDCEGYKEFPTNSIFVGLAFTMWKN